MKQPFFSKGSTLVEIILAIGMVVLILPASLENQILYSRSASSNINLTKASLLLEESVEVMKFLSGNAWSSTITPLVSDQPYYLEFSGSTWSISPTPNTIDSFTRTVILNDVYRTGNYNIDPNGMPGDILDPNTKKLTVTVSWTEKNTVLTRTLTTYIFNIFNN